MPFEEQPKYLLHDNDAVFRNAWVQRFLEHARITTKHIAYHCHWQNGVAERVIGTLRRELLDHLISINPAFPIPLKPRPTFGEEAHGWV